MPDLKIGFPVQVGFYRGMFNCENIPEGVNPIFNPMLSSYTTFRLGGAAPLLLECRDESELTGTLLELRNQDITYHLMGQGSNLLVSDAGSDRVIVRYYNPDPSEIEFCDGLVNVSGAVGLDLLSEMAARRGYGGLSFCSGIPGTVAGAVAGNAGAFGSQISDVLKSLLLLSPAGKSRTVPIEELDFSYRHSSILDSGETILRVSLDLNSHSEKVNPLEKRAEILKLRRERHPDWKKTPCAGSVFRNIEPASQTGRRQAAGWYLERAGAKKLRLGGAHVFAKHANIIVAEPGCSAADVYGLSQLMRRAVLDEFGIELVREIRLVGDF